MGAGQKKRMLASILLITTLSLLVVGCKAARVPAQITSATAPSAQSEPTISEIKARGEEVNFEICGESTSWTRPSESDQDTKWWRSGRYAGLDEQAVKYPWTHGFFVTYGSASLEYDLINLSGLWTLPGDARTKCLEQSDTILKLQTAELWALYHRVKGITRLNTCYVVTVESVDTGVQFVHFSRPKDHLPMTLHFVDENGQEIDTIAEAENWPYPQLNNRSLTGSARGLWMGSRSPTQLKLIPIGATGRSFGLPVSRRMRSERGVIANRFGQLGSEGFSAHTPFHSRQSFPN
jgi:hypothetical protein